MLALREFEFLAEICLEEAEVQTKAESFEVDFKENQIQSSCNMDESTADSITSLPKDRESRASRALKPL